MLIVYYCGRLSDTHSFTPSLTVPSEPTLDPSLAHQIAQETPSQLLTTEVKQDPDEDKILVVKFWFYSGECQLTHSLLSDSHTTLPN